MFLVSSILTAIHLPNYLGRKCQNLMQKVFHIRGEASFVLFMSMITGFPSSAYYISSLIDEKRLDIQSAQKIAAFSFFSNPLFILNTIGLFYLNNKKIGFIILLSHYLGNIILGICLRNRLKTNHASTKNIQESFTNSILKTSYTQVILDSIHKAFEVLLQILGIILFFLIITSFFDFLNQNHFIKAIFLGFFEITSGLKEIAGLPLSLFWKGLLSSFLLSFGGFCVHAQIMNLLQPKKIKYGPFFIARILHACIATILFVIFYCLIFH